MSSDIVAVTETLRVEDLIEGYKNLLFPWPFEGESFVPWFSPEERGVLLFEDFHISKSNKKLLRKSNFEVTYCTQFHEVIYRCSVVKRKDQEGTWITEDILLAYKKLFELKKAYSVEVWDNGDLVGGMYGVISERYVSGESMFFSTTGASKVAFISLIKKLQEIGLSFLDTQMVTPLVRSFGGKEIPKNEFSSLVKKGTIKGRDIYKRLTI